DDFLHLNGSGSVSRTDYYSYFKLESSVLNEDNQETYLLADEKGIYFNTICLTPLSKLEEIVDYAKIHKDVKPWIIRNVQAKAPVLEHLSGYIPYNNPSQILHTLYAKGYWSDVAYTFQQGFEPAKAKRVDIYFEKGELSIIPRNAKFYSHNAGSPLIAIDFKPKEYQLLFHLDTIARLDKALLALIRSYKIDLPVEQKKGLLEADLKIFINLETNAIGALGDFKLSESVVAFEGINYKVHSGQVKIKDSDVRLVDLNITYKTLANAMLNGFIQAVETKGKLDIDLHEINFLEKPKIVLQKTPLHVSYTLIPNHLDKIEIDKSLWSAFNKPLHIEAIKGDFNYDTLQMLLPTTPLYIENHLYAELQGIIDVKHEHYDLNASLTKFDLFNFKLMQKDLHVSLDYNESLSVNTRDNSLWHYATLPVEVDNLDAYINEDSLVIHDAQFTLDEDLQSNFRGELSLSDLNGSFQLEQISVNNDKIGNILSHKASIPLKLSIKDNKFDMAIPKLNFSMLALKEGWRLSIGDISQFEPYSALMQEFNIAKGSLHMGKTAGKEGLYFAGEIEYKYPFLVQKMKPQHHYSFSGTYDKNITSMSVNDNLHIVIDKYIDVTCKDIGLNIAAFVDFIKDHNSSESNESSIPFSLHATNSFIYFSPQRKALADTLSIMAKDDDMFATLTHRRGGAGLEMHKKQFYLYGQHFGDTFMNNFFSLSEHKGGNFSFTLKGSLDTFKGVARIDDTRIKDYVLFNNVLAFINTIPSLASFSFPSYAKEGIKIHEAYAAFEYREDIMHFNAVKFDSGEVDIYGKGDADYFNNTIDVQLNLKTHLGKNVSKLPVVGYILVGDDGTAATTFSIEGKLNDPSVKTALAKDIAIAPFNILKRAIVYPFQLIRKLIKDENKTKELDPTHFLEQ
ncbi:MAG: AsmA-like C-terminal domain-containing protein, partial [Campylobacterota bacterium]|nr:AsmA-like C-terminal domain-containing protein [Campylobacterota bacterium]